MGVAPADADASFGVVPVDPVRGLCAIQVWADRLPPGRRAARADRRAGLDEV